MAAVDRAWLEPVCTAGRVHRPIAGGTIRVRHNASGTSLTERAKRDEALSRLGGIFQSGLDAPSGGGAPPVLISTRVPLSLEARGIRQFTHRFQ